MVLAICMLVVAVLIGCGQIAEAINPPRPDINYDPDMPLGWQGWVAVAGVGLCGLVLMAVFALGLMILG